jgi:putative two-component system response regulator
MRNPDSLMNSILSESTTAQSNPLLQTYVLESFAKQVDTAIENELLKKLILDYATIAGQVDVLYRELVRSQEMLVEAQNIAMLGRWDVDRDSGKVVWSQSLYHILEKDASLPASIELFISSVHPDDVSMVVQLYEQMFEKSEPWTTRYRLLMRDGRMKWVHLRCNPVIDRSGRITQCYGTIQDITEMKQAEEELEEYSRHLEIKVEEKVKEISASQMATIYALVKLSESRDDDTGVHIERTAGFCRLLAEQARSIPRYAALMDDTFIETIFKASPLHDIGKVGIPDRILLKPGKLTGEEFEIMKTHVRIGYETLAKVGAQYQQNTFIKMGLDIVLYHHEKWNGSGYQAGLSGEQIPLSARIMAVADVYDALRSKRVYKEAFSHEKSVEIIAEGRGSHFDPLLIDLFLEHHEAFQSLYETMR